MKLTLPAEAVEAFDQRAAALVPLLTPMPADQQPPQSGRRQPPPSSSFAHRFVEALPPDGVVIHTLGTVDPAGRPTSRFFGTPEGWIGLQGDAFEAAEGLVGSVAEHIGVRNQLSEAFIRDRLFEWLLAMSASSRRGGPPFVTRLLERAEDAVRPQRVSLPVRYLGVDSPFAVGPVTLDFLRKEFFDEFEAARSTGSGNPADARETVGRLRKKYQGLVCASVEVLAEPARALEVAKERAERALRVLRFHSPVAFIPELQSYIGLTGEVLTPSTEAFVSEGGAWTLHERGEEKRRLEWHITSANLQMMKSMGLEPIAELLFQDHLTKFEEPLVAAIGLFDRALMSGDLDVKLVLTLSAAETLFLTGGQDPVQRTLGQRLAIIAAKQPHERREIVDAVKQAYGMRSGFLHHGRSRQDFRVLGVVQRAAWCAIQAVSGIRNQHNSQGEFLALVDDALLWTPLPRS